MGVVAHGNGVMDIVSYAWGEGKDVVFGRRSCRTGLSDLRSIVLSEDLARVVVNHRSGSVLFELDNEMSL